MQTAIYKKTIGFHVCCHFKKNFLTKYKMADTTLASEVAKLTSCGKKIPSTETLQR